MGRSTRRHGRQDIRRRIVSGGTGGFFPIERRAAASSRAAWRAFLAEIRGRKRVSHAGIVGGGSCVESPIGVGLQKILLGKGVYVVEL
jgi:hypothetical protein